ncbi:MAG: hypothetical protein AAFQ68_03485 [Bacteroidota bacterium]
MNLLKIKSNIAFALLITLMFALTACDPQDGMEDAIAEEEIDLVELESEVSGTMDDIEEFAFEAMEVTDPSSFARSFPNASARAIPACATVTHDSTAKTILIDFGTGCVGPDGKTRSGQLLITYTMRLYRPGATLSLASISYAVNGVSVEGTKTITNVSASFQDNLSLNVSLPDGKLTFPNGDTVTRVVDKTYTWVRAANPALDEFHVDGSIQGNNRAGETYNCQILSTLIWKRKCKRLGIRIPVEGTKLIQKGSRPDLTADFGDGTCDHLITLSANGNSRVIDLSQR